MLCFSGVKRSLVFGVGCMAAIAIATRPAEADDFRPAHPWANVGDALAIEGGLGVGVGAIMYGAAFCISFCSTADGTFQFGGVVTAAIGGGVALGLGLPLALARTKTVPSVVSAIVGVSALFFGSMSLVAEPFANAPYASDGLPPTNAVLFTSGALALLPLGAGFTTTAIGLAVSKGDGVGGMVAGGTAFVVGGVLAAVATALVVAEVPRCPEATFAHPRPVPTPGCFFASDLDSFAAVAAPTSVMSITTGATMLIGVLTHGKSPVAVVPFAQGAAIVGTF